MLFEYGVKARRDDADGVWKSKVGLSSLYTAKLGCNKEAALVAVAILVSIYICDRKLRG